MSVAKNPGAAQALETVDPIWTSLRSEAEDVVQREPALAGFVYTYILNHERLEGAVAHRIADRLDSQAFDGGAIARAFDEILRSRVAVPAGLARLVAVFDRIRLLALPELCLFRFHASDAPLSHVYGSGRQDFAFYRDRAPIFRSIATRVPMGKASSNWNRMSGSEADRG